LLNKVIIFKTAIIIIKGGYLYQGYLGSKSLGLSQSFYYIKLNKGKDIILLKLARLLRKEEP
jgi:hypothetical protein